MSFFYRRIHGAFISISLLTTRNALPLFQTFLLSRRTFQSERIVKPLPKIDNAIGEFLKVRDLRKMVDQFKSLSRHVRFRQRPKIYQETIRRLTAAKKFSWVEEILENQKKYRRCMVNEDFIIRIITLYGKSGMFNHARRLFDKIPYFHCRRTVKSFNSLLEACVASKNHHQIDDIFRKLPEELKIAPDLISYNTVCRAYLGMGSCDLILSVIEEMEKKFINPDSLTYGILLDGLYQNGRASETEDVWRTMRSKGIKPCINCFNSRLRHFVSEAQTEGNLERALHLYYRTLRTKRIHPDRVTFHIMLKLYHDAKNWKEAKKLYVTLPIFRVTADSKIYETLILFGTEMGDWEFSFEISLLAISRFIFLQKAPLQGLLDLLVEKSKPEQAKQLVDSIQECFDIYGYQLMLPEQKLSSIF